MAGQGLPKITAEIKAVSFFKGDVAMLERLVACRDSEAKDGAERAMRRSNSSSSSDDKATSRAGGSQSTSTWKPHQSASAVLQGHFSVCVAVLFATARVACMLTVGAVKSTCYPPLLLHDGITQRAARAASQICRRHCCAPLQGVLWHARL